MLAVYLQKYLTIFDKSLLLFVSFKPSWEISGERKAENSQRTLGQLVRINLKSLFELYSETQYFDIGAYVEVL
jgi:hypothetical protein